MINEAKAASVFRIRGMTCAEEVAALKREVGPVVGGQDHLAFDLLNERMTVRPSALGVSTDSILQAITRTGMSAEVWRGEPSTQPKRDDLWRHRARLALTTASGLFTSLGFLMHVWAGGGLQSAFGSEGLGMAHHVPPMARAIYGLGILAGMWLVLPKAWLAIRCLRPDMNFLMTMAILGAVVIGEWFEASTVAFLFALSLTLESWSVRRARRAVESLLKLTPPTARLIRPDESIEEVPPARVPVGAHFLVRPGERIPLDGRVIRGTTEVDQAPITGESVPVPKTEGQEVFAGTVNGDGTLTVECTKPAGDTTLAHIIRLVGEAQSRRAPSEQWVEKFARVYTPAVMALALLVVLAPPLFCGASWQEWSYRSLVLLVIACPCALVISTPVSIVAALAAAARNGVLIKGGLNIETPARLEAIAFDKTGTLTEGRPHVVDVVPLNGHTADELLTLAAAMEAQSNHPLARAIITHARQCGIAVRPAQECRIVQGKGAVGRFDGREYWIGSHRYFEERGHETEEIHRRLEALSAGGHTVVVLGTPDHACGFIALADTVRQDAARALLALRDAGIKHLVMLTGDNRGAAEAIARETSVDEIHANLVPEDKVAAVENLVAKYGRVAMVGDGINDAPALGRATLGVAMGAIGSDAAIEAADVALMSDDLSKLPWLVWHSRRTLAVIRQNIGFSLAVKMLFVALTFAGYSTLWLAITADMGASLLVIANGLRLLRPPPVA